MKSILCMSLALLTGTGIFIACNKPDAPVAAPDPMVAGFNAPASIVAGKEAAFINTSTGAKTYGWKINNVEVSAAPHLKHTFPAAGQYVVSLTAHNGITSLSKDTTITVAPVLQAGFTMALNPGNESVFAARLHLDATSNGDTYELNLNDGNGPRGWSGADTICYLVPKENAAGSTGYNHTVILTAKRGAESVEANHILNMKDPAMKVYYPASEQTFRLPPNGELSNMSGQGSVSGAEPSDGGVDLSPNSSNAAKQALDIGSGWVELPRQLLQGLPVGNAVSVSFHIKVKDMGVNWVLPILTSGSNQNYELIERMMYYDPAGGSGIVARWPNSGGHATMKAPLNNPTQWHHVALMVTGTVQKIYIDGVEAASMPCNDCIVGNSTTMQYGRIGLAPIEPGVWNSSYFDMDNIRFFSRPLTEKEIKALASEK